MRQAGIIQDERDAHRFAAWLVTQRVEAHAEQEGAGWAIWVRDEDQLAKAREALAHFQAHPQDGRYRNAERSAEQLQREEDEQRRKARGNVVMMSGRWSSGPGSTTARRCPLVLILIGLSVLTFLAGQGDPRGGVESWLLFTSPVSSRLPDGTLDYWSSIQKGEVWRLITPIFIHMGILHLVLNMLWLWDFGGQIENRRGTGRFLLMVLALAVASNVGQAMEMAWHGAANQFGGMSGVGYGLFGFLIVKVRLDNRDAYRLHPTTAFVAIAWFILCIVRDYPPFDGLLGDSMGRVANTAHAVGLFLGMALAYLPLLVRKPA